MRFIDTHAHLDFPEFDQDRADLIQDLTERRIGVINIATDSESIDKVSALTRSSADIWGTLGLHPTEITADVLLKLPQTLEQWRNHLAENERLVAIGEVGLDYHYDRSSGAADNQKAALRQFLTFAKETSKPVVFHCRDAYGDLLTILKDYSGIEGVIHCFSGSRQQAESFLDLGLKLSFTANLTYPKNEPLREVIGFLDDESFMLETDCPFLSPQSRRGERNDPRSVEEIAQTVADIRRTNPEKIGEMTTLTARKFFKLDSIV